MCSGAVNESKRSAIHSEAYEVVADIDVFSVGMEPTIERKCDCDLVVAVKGRRIEKWLEHFSKKTAEPEPFFCSMCSSDILCFSCRKCD